jgi:hypothetical protein
MRCGGGEVIFSLFLLSGALFLFPVVIPIFCTLGVFLELRIVKLSSLNERRVTRSEKTHLG